MKHSEKIDTAIPPELYAMLKTEARRLGVCVETLCLSFLCHEVTHTHRDTPKAPGSTPPKA